MSSCERAIFRTAIRVTAAARSGPIAVSSAEGPPIATATTHSSLWAMETAMVPIPSSAARRAGKPDDGGGAAVAQYADVRGADSVSEARSQDLQDGLLGGEPAREELPFPAG